MNTVMEKQVTLISPHEAQARQGSGELVILDVRTGVEYAQVHAKDAQHISLDTFDATAVMKRYPGKAIACICKSGTRGGKATQLLLDAGYDRAVNIAGGTEAWVAEGLPVEKNANVMSLERQVRIAAGFLVFAGTVLAYFANVAFLIIPGFVGAGLMFAGITDFCGMGLLIAKMPWNRNLSNKKCGGASCAAS